MIQPEVGSGPTGEGKGSWEVRGPTATPGPVGRQEQGGQACSTCTGAEAAGVPVCRYSGPHAKSAPGASELHSPALAHPGVGQRILHCHILVTAVRPHCRLCNLWQWVRRQHKTAVVEALQQESDAPQCACTGSAQCRASAAGASEARTLQ